MAASTPRLVKVSFSCLMCGLETPSIEIRIDALSRAAVRRALTAVELPGFRPLWDASLTPHCPRCRGRLLLELGSVSLWRQLEAAQA
jgi:hypothetical protein